MCCKCLNVYRCLGVCGYDNLGSQDSFCLPPFPGLALSQFAPGCVQHSERKLGDGGARLDAPIAQANLKLLPYPQSSETQTEDLEK